MRRTMMLVGVAAMVVLIAALPGTAIAQASGCSDLSSPAQGCGGHQEFLTPNGLFFTGGFGGGIVGPGAKGAGGGGCLTDPVSGERLQCSGSGGSAKSAEVCQSPLDSSSCTREKP
jgi:hypothetical protein